MSVLRQHWKSYVVLLSISKLLNGSEWDELQFPGFTSSGFPPTFCSLYIGQICQSDKLYNYIFTVSITINGSVPQFSFLFHSLFLPFIHLRSFSESIHSYTDDSTVHYYFKFKIVLSSSLEMLRPDFNCPILFSMIWIEFPCKVSSNM